ncbi:Leucine--tRNA ligase [Dirofilaria immitis]
MLLPYYCLIATLPLCITQILTENDLSVQAKITVQLDLNEYNRKETVQVRDMRVVSSNVTDINRTSYFNT